MSSNQTPEQCGTKFIDDDDTAPFECDRGGRHIVHRDSRTGTRAVRVPGGAYISRPSK